SPSSWASPAARGGTRPSRYAATRGASRFIATPWCVPSAGFGKPLIRAQMPQCRGPFSHPIIQPRHVEVSVCEPGVGRECHPISFEGIGRAVQIFEGDSEVERRRRVLGVLPECGTI